MTRRLVTRGFTLIELLVVLAIAGSLLAIAMPRYFASVDHSREVALRHNLAAIREAIDRHYGDTGRYPNGLQELVDSRYLRSVPVDPISEKSSTWTIVAPDDPATGTMKDVRSGAEGNARDGTPYGNL